MNATQMKVRSTLKGTRGESGINMVDLMMWLVVAALLLAAVIQGIGYYQKASNIYVLKNDLNNAAAVAHAQASLGSGTIDDAALDATLASAAKTSGTTLSYGTMSAYAAGELKQPGDSPYGFEQASVVASTNGLVYVMTATNSAYPDTMVYLYLEKTTSTSDGIVIGSPGSEPVTVINTTATPTATASPSPTATATTVSTAADIPFPITPSACQGTSANIGVMMKIDGLGSGTVDPSCNAGPSGAMVTGGFGWLVQDVNACSASVDLAVTASGSGVGTSGPANCASVFASWKSTIDAGGSVSIKVPLFNTTTGTGTSQRFGLIKYATFNVTGWKFDGSSESGSLSYHNTSTFSGPNACVSMCRGVIGKFTSIDG